MSDLKWQYEVPTAVGWYWVSYPGGRKSMWFFDGSEEDSRELNKTADRFYGPLQPPEDDDQ